jgi:sulfonate dioxygenase
LLNAPGSTFDEITPAIGTEIHGLQLSGLTDQQKDELSLFAAERGVLVFRDQDFAHIGPERQREFGKHFGKLHVHQHGGHVKDFPELLPVYRDFTAGNVDNEIKNNVSSIKWHTDMSYEMYDLSYQNSWYSLLTYEAMAWEQQSSIRCQRPRAVAIRCTFRRQRRIMPSPTFTSRGFMACKPLILGLIRREYRTIKKSIDDSEYYCRRVPKSCFHAGSYSVQANRDRPFRRPNSPGHQGKLPVCESPLHPAHPRHEGRGVGEASQYLLSSRHCIAYNADRNPASILQFLYNHIEHGQDWHLRIHWTPGTAVVYDNRVTQQ